MALELDEYLASVRAEGRLLAAAFEAAGPDAPIVTCPGWTMRDLVLHLGEVHRWAAALVSGAIVDPSTLNEGFLGEVPADAGLLPWFADGHAALIEVLLGAPGDLECFTFLADPPPPLLFWARRQAHEIEIHRVDAESAGGVNTPIPSRLAADGIDEILTGFAPRRRTGLRSDPPVTLQVMLDDAPDGWLTTIGNDSTRTQRTGTSNAAADAGAGVRADCSVAGRANDVYQALWNRSGAEALWIEGDPAVLDLFRDNVKIRWS